MGRPDYLLPLAARGNARRFSPGIHREVGICPEVILLGSKSQASYRLFSSTKDRPAGQGLGRPDLDVALAKAL